jgi:hypothetical protein
VTLKLAADAQNLNCSQEAVPLFGKAWSGPRDSPAREVGGAFCHVGRLAVAVETRIVVGNNPHGTAPFWQRVNREPLVQP